MIKKIYNRFEYLDYLNEKEINKEFLDSFAHRDYELIEYLLTSDKLHYKADIHTKNDIVLFNACRERDLTAVKFLLTSSKLKEHSNINAKNKHYGSPIKAACIAESLDIIQFLLTEPQFKDKINLKKEFEDIFHAAFFARSHNSLKYLIIEFELEKTEYISHLLSNYPAYSSKSLEDCFNKVELKKDLANNLVSNTKSKKQVKI
jgi:hypothetical protein